VLTGAERPVGVGIFTTGYRVALIVAFAGASKLFGNVFHAWQPVYLVMAGCMLLGLIGTLLAPGTEASDRPPATFADAITLPFIDFFQRSGIWYGVTILLFIVTYKLSDAMMNAMSIPFLKASCFTQERIGDINGLMGMIATIFGALLGGVLLTKLNIFQGLWIFGGLQAVGIIFYIFLAQLTHPDPAITDVVAFCKTYTLPDFADQLFILAINVENFCAGMESSAFGLFLMNMCNPQFSATQFALLSSLMALSKLLIAPSGDWVKALGWSNFFWVTMFVIVPSMLLLVIIARSTKLEDPALSDS
jgi:MFS transporter, PAT family, beta-lactamase induction signal transducer AmpG